MVLVHLKQMPLHGNQLAFTVLGRANIPNKKHKEVLLDVG